ncbi:glucose-6-phosphate isomerase [Tabrizicola sp.]|uniref:glucose-6-phosphate isomerase n=1 Tax=Tabrizicola sp. TaxID=2005166 RepID=UPI002617AD9B|nr:glucose-6-phosphate isomerase [Tabrizicola sp.]MDM7930916.1 glucose-6-phosphate isomerase [Tabrizicola sp.]
MHRILIVAIAASALGLAGCDTMTPDQQVVAGGLTGAAAGILTADLLDANKEWTIVAALAGAAVGSMVARNNVTDECAYKLSDGTYRIAPCP